MWNQLLLSGRNESGLGFATATVYQLICICVKEFYEDDDCTSVDFSMTELLGRSRLTGLTTRGRTLTPERIVPARIKNGLELPGHLEIVPAPPERIETALRRAT